MLHIWSTHKFMMRVLDSEINPISFNYTMRNGEAYHIMIVVTINPSPFDTFIVSSYVMVKNCFKQAKWLSICYPEEGIMLVRICKSQQSAAKNPLCLHCHCYNWPSFGFCPWQAGFWISVTCSCSMSWAAAAAAWRWRRTRSTNPYM